MSDDLVKRLRYQADTARNNYPEVFRVSEDITYEAADRIEKLEAALREIAAHPDPYKFNDEMAIIARCALDAK